MFVTFGRGQAPALVSEHLFLIRKNLKIKLAF